MPHYFSLQPILVVSTLLNYIYIHTHTRLGFHFAHSFVLEGFFD